MLMMVVDEDAVVAYRRLGDRHYLVPCPVRKLLGCGFLSEPSRNHELSRSDSPVHRQMCAHIILDNFGKHLAHHMASE